MPYGLVKKKKKERKKEIKKIVVILTKVYLKCFKSPGIKDLNINTEGFIH